MGFDLKKAALKQLLPMAIDLLPMLDNAIEDYRNEWAAKEQLEPGEDIVGVLFTAKKVTHINICVLSSDNAIKKQLVVMPFSEFVMKLVQEFKKV
jgi:hypothetical protein